MTKNAISDLVGKFLKEHESNDKESYGETLSKIYSELNPILNEALVDARLAHFKHAIEYLARNKFEREVSIVYDEWEGFEYLPSGKKSNVKFYYNSGRYLINFPGKLDDHVKRFLIGHELGHIAIAVLSDKIYDPEKHKYPKSREKLASILCWYMHVSQSNYYSSKAKDYIYEKEELKKLSEKIFNETEVS